MSTNVLPHIVVTGAAGFVAQTLIHRHLLPLHTLGRIRLTLTDRQDWQPPDDGVRLVSADITSAAVWHSLFEQPVDVLFNFAGIVSGRAETDFEVGLAVNLHAALMGLAQCRRQFSSGGPLVRWIHASSIGVFGPPLPACMDDHTPAQPALSYGTHKRMIELMLNDLSRRGEVDGRSLRLSGVVVRPPLDNGALSAFNSDLIREPLAGRRITCPVLPTACLWMSSVNTTADQLWRLSEVPLAKWMALQIKHRTGGVVNAPTWPVVVHRLVQALGQIDPDAPARIDFDPKAPLQAQFGNWPQALDFALARELNLPSDLDLCRGDLVAFVRSCLAQSYS